MEICREVSPLLKGLRKYITRKRKIEEGSISWYLKFIMERSKNKELINDFIVSTKENVNIVLDNEIYIFNYLINDFHLTDTLSMEQDNFIIRLILSALIDDFIIETDHSGLVNFYLRHTRRGNELIGIKKRDVLTDFVEENWEDLVHEFDSIDDDSFKKDIYFLDDYIFVSMIVVVDEHGENYDLVKETMELMCFSEIVPGMFFYGSYGYGEFEECDMCLSNDDLLAIVDIISEVPIVQNLDRYDGIINYYNLVEDCVDKYLYILLRDRSSGLEVLF